VWTDEIGWMSAAVAAWDFLRSSADVVDQPALDRLRMVRNRVVHATAFPLLDDPTDGPKTVLTMLLTNDVEAFLNGQLAAQVVPRMAANTPEGLLTLSYEPHTLRGALWLQLAEAISQNKQLRRCDFCGRWFEVSPRATGKPRLFCSNACRVKAYKRRQIDAHALYNTGTPIPEIAAQLGSNTDTVRGWLGFH
jgi:hypothetical protein